MGTSKKFLLASLVGLAMVLAFVLGAMPGFDQSRLAASGDQVNIQDVLDALLGDQEKGETLSVVSAVQAVLIKTPAGDNYVTPEIPLPLELDGSVGNVPVRYVASVEGDNTPWSASANPNNPGGAGTWTSGAARTFTDPAVFAAPYGATLDAGAFVTGVASTRTVLIYGLANAQLTNGEAATITYSSATPDPYAVGVTEVDGDVTDVDGNGIPDQPFDQVDDAQIWTANIGGRTVLVVNLDTVAKGGAQVFSSPADGITVQAPSTADLIAANAINDGESALLVVQVADSLAELLDDEAIEPGSESFTDAAGWAAAVQALPPVSARSVAGPVLDVSIVVSDGVSLVELDTLPETLPVTLTLEDLTVGPDEELSLFSYQTSVATGTDGLVLGNDPGLQEWNLIESGISSGTLSVDVTSLSAFVPFLLPALQITDTAPNTALEGEEVALTLSGTIPVATALSISEAAAAYVVTVNGSEATFRNGPAGAAIDALVNGQTNAMYLYWNAAINTKATQNADIVISKIDGANVVELQQISNALVITPTYTVAASAGAGGSVSIDTPANGPGGTYSEGSSVTITATPDSGFEFVAWAGLEGAEANTASTTITVNSDRVVAATFQPESTGGDEFTLSITKAGNGSGTVSPAAPLTVADGTVVTIVATPASSSKFVSWTGDVAGVANTAAATTTVTVTADTNLVANFTKKTAADEPLTVTGLDAEGGLNDEGQVEVWLFGGETIRINGTGLVAGADSVAFQVGSNPEVTADLYNVAPDGSFGLVVIPPTNDTSNSEFVLASLTVRRASDNAEFNFGNVIRYRRYNTNEDNVTTTAFILDTPATGGSIEVSTGAGNTNFATLTLPGLDTNLDSVYGLVRAGVVDTKGNNTEEVVGPVGTGQIGDGIAGAFGGSIPGTTPAQTVLPGTVDVAFYLYGGAPADADKTNTGEVGAPAFQPSNNLITFDRGASGAAGDLPTPGDPEGNAGNAATFEVALADGVLTHGDVRDGLTIWGVETSYDYVTDTLEAVEDAEVAYQSELLSAEVTPEVLGEKQNTADATSVDTVSLRLYSLNGFSLRQNVVIPPDVAAGVRLNTQGGTASGPLAGGTALTVVSPNGGLAWLEKADLVIDGAVVGTVTDFTTTRGDDEYVLQFTTPAASRAGIADIVLTGRANPNAIQAINLENAFEIKAGAGVNPLPWILLGLGLLAALLGLAAGGSSGGGGGGPCFIATAAYGTPLDGDIDTLRQVRDEFLLTNTVGTAFTDTYYRVAPTVADSVAASPMLAAVVRVMLVPVIFLGKMALTSPALMALVALSLGFFFWSKRKGARQS